MKALNFVELSYPGLSRQAVLLSFFTLLLCLFSKNNQAQPRVSNANPGNEQILTYCVDPDWLPYEAIEQGQHTGMSSGYLQRLKQYTGLQLQFRPTGSWKETLQLLREEKCHLTPMLNKSEDRERFLTFSDVYLYAPNVLVSRREEPFLQGLEHIGDRRLAIPKGYRLLEYVKRHFPDLDVIEVDRENAGLMAVADGRADVFVGSLYSVNAYVQQQALLDLKINGWAWPQDELRMAVIPRYASLLPVINEALASFSETDHLAVQQQWNNVRIIEKQDYTLTRRVALITLMIILLLAAWNLIIRRYNLKLEEKNGQLESLKTKLENSNRELEFLSNHDPLTKLYNRNFFNTSMQPDNRAVSEIQRCSLILLDIDHFKEINDEYGHNAGDSVLQELSNVLNQCVREQDVVARWGGEEFVVMSQQDSIIDAKALAMRIAQKIQSTEFIVKKTITCSFGIARLQEHESMTDCFERADKALYQAKAKGRDCICISEEQT
ncbi:diguanylate cyclase [Lacimicrobium alkaliphilum]|uniref:diguanylate cyclase n=1 Tax=Lacimicrobium alkaliphilum TaxID=1526571 RepID=A0ABQ1R371_9ALTE|nr:diguanylate cyclase [Lacimicrobium alkaliphilum]GGD56612.1 diguanylate cyclase [Lacimicrobium alkaliphilum]